MQVEILDVSSGKLLFLLTNLSLETSVADIKKEIQQRRPWLNPYRQSLRLEPKGANLHDSETLSTLKILNSIGGRLYLRDLGPQISWQTVFLLEYFGPFAIYPLFYLQPAFIYTSRPVFLHPLANIVQRVALFCWTFHFGKRLYETVCVHRFSHATMPLRNLVKNCGYYWTFATYIAYYVNHPLYTPPYFGVAQLSVGLGGFLLAEYGNLCVHLLLRDLRAPGSSERKIPQPNNRWITGLFKLVCCPNYTYEVLAWLCFSVMTQCLPALFFTVAGATQMTVWALAKRRAYRKEFSNFPRNRKAIFPYLL